MPDFSSLLPKTAHVLQSLSALAPLHDFTFVGGSGLALHLNHRLSEDLDFFTWEAHLPIQALQIALQNVPHQQLEFINLSPTQMDMVLDGVKVTFFANNWQELQERVHIQENLYLATPELLAAMKVNTLFLRAKYRDYYDLYVLHRERFSLKELYDLTVAKMHRLSTPLFQRALIFTDDIEDESITHLKPKYQVSLPEIAKHFEEAIKAENS